MNKSSYITFLGIVGLGFLKNGMSGSSNRRSRLSTRLTAKKVVKGYTQYDVMAIVRNDKSISDVEDFVYKWNEVLGGSPDKYVDFLDKHGLNFSNGFLSLLTNISIVIFDDFDDDVYEGSKSVPLKIDISFYYIADSIKELYLDKSIPGILRSIVDDAFYLLGNDVFESFSSVAESDLYESDVTYLVGAGFDDYVVSYIEAEEPKSMIINMDTGQKYEVPKSIAPKLRRR